MAYLLQEFVSEGHYTVKKHCCQKVRSDRQKIDQCLLTIGVMALEVTVFILSMILGC
jgi:hypothetical protein